MPSVSCLGPEQASYIEQNTASVEFHDSQDRHFGGLGRDALGVLRKKDI
jgi:hypothetical protein